MSENDNEERFWEAIQKNMEERFKLIREHQQELSELYPPDVPNERGNHAIISGLLIDNAVGLKTGDYTPLLKTKFENLYVWTHTKDRYSSIISEISTDIKDENLWKSIGHVLELTLNYVYSFEHLIETNYHWIYYFDNTLSVEENEFMNTDHQIEGTFSGQIEPFAPFKTMSPLIKLLIKDDVFYTSMNMFNNSMKLHWFCLICEVFNPIHLKHPNHEPERWEQARLIPNMEAAIVQSCRAVEAILGKPGKNTERVKDRWKSAIDLNPNDVYKKANMSYYDYYYQLFQLRNSSAHNLGEIAFSLSRERTIEAQSFAFIVIDSYLKKHMTNEEEASNFLELNEEIIAQEPRNWFTPRTND